MINSSSSVRHVEENTAWPYDVSTRWCGVGKKSLTLFLTHWRSSVWGNSILALHTFKNKFTCPVLLLCTSRGSSDSPCEFDLTLLRPVFFFFPTSHPTTFSCHAWKGQNYEPIQLPPLKKTWLTTHTTGLQSKSLRLTPFLNPRWLDYMWTSALC